MNFLRHICVLIMIIILLITCQSKKDDNTEETAAAVIILNEQQNSSSGDTEPSNMTGMTSAHNTYRTQTSSTIPDLKWSSTIATYAQEWADELKNQGCPLTHRTDNKYGENLFWGSGKNYTVQEVVDSWYSENQYYTYAPYGDGDCQSGQVCGHYTQVIWKDTTEIGCGYAACDSSEIWVCNYNPPGNYSGQYPY